MSDRCYFTLRVEEQGRWQHMHELDQYSVTKPRGLLTEGADWVGTPAMTNGFLACHRQLSH